MLGSPPTEGGFKNLPGHETDRMRRASSVSMHWGGKTAYLPVRIKVWRKTHRMSRRGGTMSGEREIQISSGSGCHHKWVDSGGQQMTIIVPPTVYPPSEDSTLLDRALNTIIGEGKMLEIGCGTGVVSVSAAKRGWTVDACDVNPLAIATARGLAEQEGVVENTRFIEAGLPESLSKKAVNDWAPSPPYNIICWNLPYLDPPKLDEPRLGPLEEASMSDIDTEGGWSRKLRNQLENTPNLLARDGIVVLVHKAEGRGGRALTEWLATGWSIRPLARISFGGERLVAVALWRGWSESEHRIIDESVSTMDEMPQNAEPGTVVQAISQTSGRGQSSKLWHSNNGDLTATWRIHSGIDKISPVGTMQLGAGLAVIDTIAASAGRIAPMLGWPNASEERRRGFQLKWPNDILLNRVMLKSDSTVQSNIVDPRTAESVDAKALGKQNDVEGRTGSDDLATITQPTEVGKLAGVLMQGRSIGEFTTIDIGIGINGITRWLDNECHAGLSELSLPSDTPVLMRILSAALGGRFQKHRLLPPSASSELQQQWWALAAHQHLSKSIDQSHRTNQPSKLGDIRKTQLTGTNSEEKGEGLIETTPEELRGATSKFSPSSSELQKGSDLGEREGEAESNGDSKKIILEQRTGVENVIRIVGTDENGGLILLNSTKKFTLYESI